MIILLLKWTKYTKYTPH